MMHSSQRIPIAGWADQTLVNHEPAQEFAREHQRTRPDPEEVRASLPGSLPSRRDLAELDQLPENDQASRSRETQLVVFVLLVLSLAMAAGGWLVTRV